MLILTTEAKSAKHRRQTVAGEKRRGDRISIKPLLEINK
jgi:hypothetical protein